MAGSEENHEKFQSGLPNSEPLQHDVEVDEEAQLTYWVALKSHADINSTTNIHKNLFLCQIGASIWTGVMQLTR